MPDSPNPNFWKRKLAAFLHDSPEKVLSLLDHEMRARRIAGDIPASEMARKEADWEASAADRLPWPSSASTLTPLTCFKHPLGGAEVPLNETDLPLGVAEETSQTSRPKLNEDNPRAAFIATWRLWRNWASSRNRDFALYAAETRLPDHTIWNHLAVTSAMQGCFGGEPWKPQGDKGVADRPCFLLFTIGPVQDFIAAARSTRDLWSGSYLLSWLIGQALKRIALDFGPDHVIFPNLCDQPLMDLLLREEIWDQSSTVAGKGLFEAFGYYDPGDGRQRLLTPSLPNRFLAVLPHGMVEHHRRGPDFASAESYARALASTVQDCLTKDIGPAVSTVLTGALGDRFDATRFSAQLQRLAEIHWQVLPWPDDIAGVEKAITSLPPDNADPAVNYTPRAGLETMLHLASHGADQRYLQNGKPKQVGTAWSSLYALTEGCLNAVKSNRAFSAWPGRVTAGKLNSKDMLNGKEEACLIVDDEKDCETLNARINKALDRPHLLKPGETLGASSLLKRFWPYAWLCKRHAFEPGNLAMPNTRSLAAHEPWGDDADDDADGNAEEPKYFAVLALDGDSMGQWISGSRTPALEQVLSKQAAAVFTAAGADLNRQRPLSPSWHLQFSETLGNFAQHTVRRVVEAFDGRLIYAGGDDVLALLPADTALACARALHHAFRGDKELNDVKGIPADFKEGGKTVRRSDRSTPLFNIETPGFLRLHPSATNRHGDAAKLLDDPVSFPAIVPGPRTDVSAGIAIAHFKSPLQDAVREAQKAEKRAKQLPGKAAVAVTILKRSGETVQWVAKWDKDGVNAAFTLLDALRDEVVSSKFPYRLGELMSAYRTQSAPMMKPMDPVEGFNLTEVFARELDTVLARQRGPAWEKDGSGNQFRENFAAQMKAWLKTMLADHDIDYALTQLTALCAFCGFAKRLKD